MIKIVREKPLFEMANFSKDTTGQHFILWVDEAGKTRNNKHSQARFKVEANNVELVIVIDGNNIHINKTNPRKIQKFKYGDEALEFVNKFKIPLLMHWNKEIDTTQLGIIFRLVYKKKYTVDKAIDFIKSGEL